MLGGLSLPILGRPAPGPPGSTPHRLEAGIVLHGLLRPLLRRPARVVRVPLSSARPVPASAFTCPPSSTSEPSRLHQETWLTSRCHVRKTSRINLPVRGAAHRVRHRGSARRRRRAAYGHRLPRRWEGHARPGPCAHHPGPFRLHQSTSHIVSPANLEGQVLHLLLQGPTKVKCSFARMACEAMAFAWPRELGTVMLVQQAAKCNERSAGPHQGLPRDHEQQALLPGASALWRRHWWTTRCRPRAARRLPAGPGQFAP